MDIFYTVAIITGISSCLSIAGACIIFTSYVLIPEVRNYTRKLLVYLTVADFLTAAGNFVGVVRYFIIQNEDSFRAEVNLTYCKNVSETPMMAICEGQSFVTTLSNMASFIWTFFIAFHLWVATVHNSRMTERIPLQIVFHCISWILPLGIVADLRAKGYLGEDYCYGTGVWCGIRSNLDPLTVEKWMYIADVGWQIACYVLACFLYMYTKLHLVLNYNSGRMQVVTRNFLRNEDENFVFVWMVIYLLKLWGITRFFITTYATNELRSNYSLNKFSEFLLVMQSYGASGQAFWNCVLFCVLDQTVRNELRRRLGRIRVISR